MHGIPPTNGRYLPNLPHDFTSRVCDEWYQLCDAFMYRRFYSGESLQSVLQDLKLGVGFADYMKGRLREFVADVQMRKHLTESPKTKQYALRSLRKFSVRARAARVADAMYSLARLDEPIVRQVVSLYAPASNTDHEIEMMSISRHASIGRAFVEFVRRLGMSDLDIQLIGYTTASGAKTNMPAWLHALELPRDTLVRWQRARNIGYDSPAGHAGIEAIRSRFPAGICKDGAFHHAMLLGALVEMWRFVAPPFSPNSSTQQIHERDAEEVIVKFAIGR
jgi:hypothetical protein